MAESTCGKPGTGTPRAPRTIADLRPGDHLCCIYGTAQEHRSVVTQFLRTGLERGEKAIYIVDAHTAETILGYLHSDGLDVAPYLARGQFVVLTSDETYMREGAFDPAGMIALLRSETEQALAEGYPALRVTGEMTWVLRGLAGSGRLIEYEARLNEFFPGSQCLAICQYDQGWFAPDILLNVLRTHPIAVVGTEVHDNFYYIPPAELLSGDTSAVELRYCLYNLAERKRAREEREKLLVGIEQQRRRAEELNDFLNTVLESLLHPFYVLDAFGYTVKMANPVARQGGLLEGTTCYAMTHRSDQPCATAEHPCPLEEVKRTKQPVVAEHLHYDGDGNPRYVEVRSYPIFDGDGNVSQVIEYNLDITQRKRAEEALRASEKKHRQLVETLREGVWVIDQDAYTTYVNPSMAGMLGYTADEMVGRHLFSFMDECGVEIAKHNLERRRQGIQEQHDFEFLRKDGTRVYASLETSPITDDDGNYVGAIAGVQDITERRQTQVALRRYADRLAILYEIDRAILDARSVEGIAEVSLRHIRQVVPSVRASVAAFDFEAGVMSLLAASADGETRLGKGWRGPLEWVPFVEELCQGQVYTVENIQTGLPSSPLVEALQAEGVRAYVSVPLIAHGELIGSLNLGVDRTGSLTSEQADIVNEVANQLAIAIQQARLYEHIQRHADELEKRVAERTAALQASQARFQAIFEEAGIGVALVDEHGRLVESNPALQEMLGYAAEELCGMAFTSFIHPDDTTADMDQLEQLIAGKRDECKVEMRYFRKDRQLRWANLTVTPVQNAGDKPRFAIGMVEDITEQRQAQAALIQAEKLAIAGKLAASLAHEINNPLQSVIGCLGLAEETLAEGGNASRYLRVAHEELRRAARIVTQLRDLHQRSRPEERESTDVNGLLEQVLVLSRKQCENRGVEVAWRAATDLPLLLLVPDQMRQVFLNLLLNAVDAMPQGGRLQVSTSRTDQPAGVRIAFTDNGVGIAPDTLPHVFDPFYSTKPAGLGLGLFVSQDIVKQHGGHIEVDSQVGVGATFTVWLPASQAMAGL